VPGLLQTEEYARAVLSYVNGYGPEKTDEAWTVRLHRQEAVHERADAPEMVFVLDEAAVRRRVGRSGHTMVRQLERLKEYAAEPNIDVRIIRFEAGANPGMNGNFILLEFDEADINDLVHLESVNDITINEDAELIGAYSDRYRDIESLALSEEATVAFLNELIAEMSEGGDVDRADSPVLAG